MPADSPASLGNNIDAAGAASICQALEKNTTLQSLNLGSERRVRDNRIGHAGAAAVCQALEKNTTLQSLNLRGKFAAAQRVMHVVFSFVR